jgi:hypothetical protein
MNVHINRERRPAALRPSKTDFRLNPWTGDWVIPLIAAGGSMSRQSGTVGTMSMA